VVALTITAVEGCWDPHPGSWGVVAVLMDLLMEVEATMAVGMDMVDTMATAIMAITAIMVTMVITATTEITIKKQVASRKPWHDI